MEKILGKEETISFSRGKVSSLKNADLSKKNMAKFKRKALGFFRKNITKTLDEMAQLLYGSKIVSSIEEGKGLAPVLVEKTELVKYETYKALFFGHLRDEERKLIKNEKGENQYEITVFPCSLYLS